MNKQHNEKGDDPEVPRWLEYEHIVFEYLQFNHDGAEVRHNVRLPGRLSGVLRQIDVLVDEHLSGHLFRTAFEAKCYKRAVDVKDVEEAIGLLRDVGVDRGVMITTSGYSDAALRRAHADDVDIELDILNLAALEQFQSDGGALPYAGSHGVVIPAPLGWIIDGSRFPGTSARLWRRGLSFEEAYSKREFMYVAFWSKDSTASSVEELTERQNENVRTAFPGAEITVEPLELKGRWRSAVRTVANAYDWLEMTAYVQFDDFILFVVLHTPELVANRNRRKLEYVVAKAIPFTIIRRSESV